MSGGIVRTELESSPDFGTVGFAIQDGGQTGVAAFIGSDGEVEATYVVFADELSFTGQIAAISGGIAMLRGRDDEPEVPIVVDTLSRTGEITRGTNLIFSDSSAFLETYWETPVILYEFDGTIWLRGLGASCDPDSKPTALVQGVPLAFEVESDHGYWYYVDSQMQHFVARIRCGLE
ncbi:MAG: hypothetical protein AAGF12_25500 [Myxococcota bacterium]